LIYSVLQYLVAYCDEIGADIRSKLYFSVAAVEGRTE